MIKNKIHLFDGIPESPVGLLPKRDILSARKLSYHKPSKFDLLDKPTRTASGEPVLFELRHKPLPKKRKAIPTTWQLLDKLSAELDAADSITEQAKVISPDPVVAQIHVAHNEDQFVAPHTPSEELTPPLSVNYQNELPEIAIRAGVQNTINLPDILLKNVSRKVKRASDSTAKFMLRHVAPAILSYSAASKVVAVALKDGLDVEAEVDTSMEGVLQELTRLDLAYHYVRRTSLPKSVKRMYMKNMTEQIVLRSMAELDKHGKRTALSNMSSQLEGMVVRSRGRIANSKHKQNTSFEGNEGLRDFLQQTSGQAPGSRVAVKRSRSDRPLEGGI